MKKYFSLQCKRFARTFPVAILTLLVLLGSLLGILGLVLANRQKDADDKLPIGVVGSTEDPLLQMGLSALVYFDDTRFSMELLPMVVIKKDGSRQSFDKSKLLRGMIRACEKRPVSIDVLEAQSCLVDNSYLILCLL